MILLYN